MPNARPWIHAIAALGLTASAGLAQSTLRWASPVDGNFGVAANWDPPVVPGPMDTAVLGGVGQYTVFLDSREVGAVELANPGSTLLIGPGQDATITNLRGDGILRLEGNAPADVGRLRVRSGGVIDGNLVLDGEIAAAAAVFALGGPGVLGPSARITGQGQINGRWSGPGVFATDGPGTLWFNGILTGASLRATGGGTLWLVSATLEDGVVEIDEGGLLDSVASVARDSVFRGPVRLAYGELTIGPGVVFEDGLSVGTGLPHGDGRASVEAGATFEGVVRVDGGAFQGRPGARLGPGAIVLGTGVPSLDGVEGTFTSEGVIAMDGPGEMRVPATINGGTLRASGGGQLVLHGASLSGVTLQTLDGGGIITAGMATPLTDSVLAGPYRVRPYDALPMGDGVVADGPVYVSEGARLSLRGGIALDARVWLEPGDGIDTGGRILAYFQRATIGPDARIGGTGSFAGEFLVSGTLAPGGTDEGGGGSGGGVGVFTLYHSSRFELTPAATVEIDAAGPAPEQHDRFDQFSSDVLALAGTLTVAFVDGYEPGPADRLEIINVRWIEGAFENVSIQPAGAIPAVGPAHVVYTGTTVTVVVCAADRDGDGELTIFDFLVFQNQFDAGDMRADLDEDGALTIFDFLVFQNRFDAGCV